MSYSGTRSLDRKNVKNNLNILGALAVFCILVTVITLLFTKSQKKTRMPQKSPTSKIKPFFYDSIGAAPASSKSDMMTSISQKFTVQIATLQSEQEANSLLSRLDNINGCFFVSTPDEQNIERVAVQCGVYDDKALAFQELAHLKEQYSDLLSSAKITQLD